jgi:hypothetical protein
MTFVEEFAYKLSDEICGDILAAKSSANKFAASHHTLCHLRITRTRTCQNRCEADLFRCSSIYIAVIESTAMHARDLSAPMQDTILDESGAIAALQRSDLRGLNDAERMAGLTLPATSESPSTQTRRH